MNVLIFTPFYKIIGRDELYQDNSAVHYLIKPWAKEHNVKVVYIYINKVSKCLRYLRNKDREYYKSGYTYQVDGIEVFLVEVQKIYKQGLWIESKESCRVKGMINRYLMVEGFTPDLIVSHMPTITDGILGDLFADVKKTAVLHSTDVVIAQNNEVRYKLMAEKYQTYLCRSAAIYQYFHSKGLKNLSSKLVFSGVPCAEAKPRIVQKPKSFKLLYAGKLIERKHVDVAIRALEQLKADYNFAFDIYGDGSERKKLEKLAERSLQDRCVFKGQVARDQLLTAFSEYDIFIMVSTRETLGLVYLEAMSRGCIPIGVRGEGIDGTIIDGENGYLVEANNENALSAKIKSIFDMDEKEYSRVVNSTTEAGAFYNEYDMGQRYLRLVSGNIENLK